MKFNTFIRKFCLCTHTEQLLDTHDTTQSPIPTQPNIINLHDLEKETQEEHTPTNTQDTQDTQDIQDTQEKHDINIVDAPNTEEEHTESHYANISDTLDTLETPVSLNTQEKHTQELQEQIDNALPDIYNELHINPVVHPIQDMHHVDVVTESYNPYEAEEIYEHNTDKYLRDDIIENVFQEYKETYHEFYSLRPQPMHSNFNEKMFKDLCNKFIFNTPEELLICLNNYNLSQKQNKDAYEQLSIKRKLKCDLFNFYLFI